MAIGDLLQELRNDRGLTQKEVGNMINLSSATIGAYETNINEPSIENIKFFANLYGVSADYLLELTKIRTPWSEVVNGLSVGNETIPLETFIDELTKLNPENRRILLKVLNGLSLLD